MGVDWPPKLVASVEALTIRTNSWGFVIWPARCLLTATRHDLSEGPSSGHFDNKILQYLTSTNGLSNLHTYESSFDDWVRTALGGRYKPTCSVHRLVHTIALMTIHYEFWDGMHYEFGDGNCVSTLHHLLIIDYWCLNCNFAARIGRFRIINHPIMYATWMSVLLVW